VKIVDSSGWIEYVADGPLAGAFAPHLREPGRLLTPSIVLYEVYRWLRRHRDLQTAAETAAAIERTRLVALDGPLTLAAADLSIQHGLALADSIIYATAHLHQATLVTSDAHFEGLPGVEYLAKT
jgi:predicted nucleic acid-binding protein